MRSKPTDRYHWAWHRALRRVCQRGPMRALIASIVTVRVDGEANAEGLTPPFIVVANHSSHLDAPVLMTSLPYSITRHLATAVAADYFYEQKWRSTLTSVFFNSYPVDREGRKSKRAGLSVSLLRQGVPLLIFPEGTRSRTGEMARFKPGAAALARALRVPVLPVALIGAHDAMPVGRSWPVSGRPEVRVLIGEPVEVRSGESLTDFNSRVEARVVAMHTSGSANPPDDEPDGDAAAGEQEDER